MGRKAKPQAIKLIEGNRGKRTMNRKAPQFAGTIGAPPSILSKRARELWFEIAAEWESVGIAQRAFRGLLMLTAQTWADYEEHIEKLREDANYPPGEDGLPRRHPAIKDRQSCINLLRVLFTEAGLTPSSASKIIAPKEAEDDELAKIGIA